MPTTLSTRAVLLLTLYTFTQCANAAIPVEEATKLSSYGVDRSGYTFWYAGACAERIGAIISYVGKEPPENSLPGLLQHARESAHYLLARCPVAETIEVSSRSANNPTPYRFVMRKASDWEPVEIITVNDLQTALKAGGYHTVVGPRPIYSPAFMRFDQGKVDIIYGDYLENRMVATHIESQTFSDAESQQPDVFVVRGQWYELGNERDDGRCEQSREGYPLWGTFTLTVSPTNASLPITRKRCADHHESGPTQMSEFSDLPNYIPANKPPSTALKLSNILSRSETLVSATVSGDFANVRQPLIDTKNYRVYARRPNLCSHLEFDVIYRAPNESRDRVFGGNYEQAIRNIIPAIASRRCGDPAGISVDAYSFGDDQRWDQMNFRLRPPAGSSASANRDYLVLSSHTKSQPAKARDQNIQANLLGPACSGPFCDLPGGRYINAIYRGDLNSVRQMDHLHKQAVGDFVKKQTSGLQDAFLEQLFGAAFNVDDVQMLRSVTNKYMHAYAVWGEACLDPGAEAKTFEHVTPVIVETDEYGITSESGGIKLEATYTLNPEFFKLRDTLGSYKGARRSDHPGNLPIKTAVFTGLVELTRTGDCRSAEVKQFERELRLLTERVIEEPGTTPPAKAAGQPESPTAEYAPFPPATQGQQTAANVIPWNAPAALPVMALAKSRNISTTRPTRVAAPALSVSSSGSNSTIDTSAMTDRERQEQMTAELKAANARGLQAMTALSEPLLQAKRDSVSAATRNELVAEYQRKATELQRKLQAETAEIRRKYR